MYAGSSGSNYGVNKNSPGNGNGKWQGLPPITNMRSLMIPYVKTRARGDNRDVVFCMNQLGGVGRISNMFATTADGVTDCKNGKLKWTGPYIPRNLDELLQVADKDGDGMVSKAELQKYFKGYVDADDVDLDNNNEITSNEYQTLLNYLGSKYSGVGDCKHKCGEVCLPDVIFETNADGSVRACCDPAWHTGQCCEYNWLQCAKKSGSQMIVCEDHWVRPCQHCPAGQWNSKKGCCNVSAIDQNGQNWGQCP